MKRFFSVFEILYKLRSLLIPPEHRVVFTSVSESRTGFKKLVKIEEIVLASDLALYNIIKTIRFFLLPAFWEKRKDVSEVGYRCSLTDVCTLFVFSTGRQHNTWGS